MFSCIYWFCAGWYVMQLFCNSDSNEFWQIEKVSNLYWMGGIVEHLGLLLEMSDLKSPHLKQYHLTRAFCLIFMWKVLPSEASPSMKASWYTHRPGKEQKMQYSLAEPLPEPQDKGLPGSPLIFPGRLDGASELAQPHAPGVWKT